MNYNLNRLLKIINKYVEPDLRELPLDMVEYYLWKLKTKKLTLPEKKFVNLFKKKQPIEQSKSKGRGAISASTRKKVNERDGGQCQFCGNIFEVEIAHIKSRGSGGSGNDLKNLITLCHDHHTILDNGIGFRDQQKRREIKEFIIKWREKNQ